MSPLLEDLDRALGTVGLGQACLALFARRHRAVTQEPAVALLVLAEQVRDEVVAAAVPLAAFGADLHFHRVVPSAVRGRSCRHWFRRRERARLPFLHHGRSPGRAPNRRPGKMGQLPHARSTRRPPSSGAVRAALTMIAAGGTTMVTAGEHFARALAAKDSAALCALLADPVDFQALTPGRHWQATTGRQVADEIIFEHWFGAGAHILGLCSVSTGRVSQREHVAYRLRVRRSGGDHLVEQQAYYSTEGGRISWMRVLCSGYQPVQQQYLAAG